MARYLGFDGFRGGWVMAWIEDDGRHGFTHSSKIADLLVGRFARAMIDIPIGLPERDRRCCDLRARKLLGPSVFVGVRRSLLLPFEKCSEANDYYWARSEPGISLQLWGIRTKIKEVDEIVTPELQPSVCETHPELIFWYRNDSKTLASKKSKEGRDKRIELLKGCGFGEIERMLGQRRGTGIGRDDLIDACACAVAARDSKSKVGDDKLDARGLRMEIYY